LSGRNSSAEGEGWDPVSRSAGAGAAFNDLEST
jgi:hypothetical protein